MLHSVQVAMRTRGFRMTKIIAIPLFVALLLATHIYAAEPSTGATLGAKTPHIAEKHPEALTDGRSSSRLSKRCARCPRVTFTVGPV